MLKKIIRQKDCEMAGADDFPASMHPILKRIYRHRGCTHPSQVERQLARLHTYDTLLGMDQAVQRLVFALQNRERILIIGDFDADGATSTALAVRALREMGVAFVDYLVPNRFEYGYGLTPEIVQVAKSSFQPHLIITVDNGIASVEGVDVANALQMDVIITDHHLPGKALPKASAIVNPNLQQDRFPSKALAGVGVIFYVMTALRQRLQAFGWFDSQGLVKPNMANYLDLVALGTVADVVSLDQNNRILVYQGIRRIQAGRCVKGILALLEIAKRDPSRLTASDLGFAVAPRLNAAGRLTDMRLGIECLLSDDTVTVRFLAQQLDQLNEERKRIEADMQQQAESALQAIQLDDTQTIPTGLCLYHDSWHQGIVGILAGRIKEKYHLPVIAFAKVGENEVKGSARSIPGIHIRDVLDEIATAHPQLITKFGGHAMAAGLSLPIAHLSDFSEQFQRVVGAQLDVNQLQGELFSDGELSPADFTLEFAQLLREAGPFGQHFPEPLFDGKFRVLNRRIIGDKHLKLVLRPLGSTDFSLDAIAFRCDDASILASDQAIITIAYRLGINVYKGESQLQLVIEHLE